MFPNFPVLFLAAAAVVVMLAADVQSIDVKMSVTDNDKLAKVNVEHKDEIKLDLLEKELDKQGQRLLSVTYYKPVGKGKPGGGRNAEASGESGEARPEKSTKGHTATAESSGSASGSHTGATADAGAAVAAPESPAKTSAGQGLKPRTTEAPPPPPPPPSPGDVEEQTATTTARSVTVTTAPEGLQAAHLTTAATAVVEAPGTGAEGAEAAVPGEVKHAGSITKSSAKQEATKSSKSEGEGEGEKTPFPHWPGLNYSATKTPGTTGAKGKGTDDTDEDYDDVWVMPTVPFPGRRIMTSDESPFDVYDDVSDWATATRNCANRGSELAVPRDDSDKNTIKQLMLSAGHTTEAWLGLRQVIKDSVFKDDKGVCYNNKGTMNCPTDYSGEGGCGVLTDSALFKSRLCNQKLPYVCRMVG